MDRRTPRCQRPAPLLDLMHAPPTTGMEQLRSLLNWRLLTGWHEFPGPDGGTCILEAAIVVAGLPYREVRCSGDAPPDFSPVLSEYLLQLNDRLPHGPRQQLIRFVPRFAGSAGSKAVEEARREFIVEATREGIRPIARQWFWFEERMPRARRPRLIWAAMAAASGAGSPSVAGDNMLERALAIADAAFRIGGEAEPVDPLAALVRLETARPREPRAVAKVV